MVCVFISHSRQDRALVGKIRSLLANIGYEAIIEEFIPPESKQPIPYMEIKNKLQMSSFVFLFLTDNVVLTEYTKNWVMFEISQAASLQKRLFVFERKGTPIPYPIPYLTDYMIFDETTESYFSIQWIARKASPSIPQNLITAGLGALLGLPFGPLGLIVGGLGGLILGPQDAETASIPRITCPYCGVPFNYYSPYIQTFACPSCRQWITLKTSEGEPVGTE